jgi:1-acyl-sn-glycerol-3-phosphate acyltransferase
MHASLRLRQRFVQSIARNLLPSAEHARLSGLAYADAGHGYDVFGMHPDWVRAARALAGPLYRHYFRVSSYGSEVIPKNGPALLIANHAGTLPIDAALLWLDVLAHTDPPRVVRPIVDHFVPELPFVGVLFGRLGSVSGTQNNVRHLLGAGELCLIFPEGIDAIGKPFQQRYKLQGWRVGHAEAALRHGVPVIPVAVIGSEEQWPQIGKLERLRMFGAPYLPIPATPVPLPVHYRIHYGEPIDLRGEIGSDLTTESVARAAAHTRAALETLLARGLAARKGVFV